MLLYNGATQWFGLANTSIRSIESEHLINIELDFENDFTRDHVVPWPFQQMNFSSSSVRVDCGQLYASTDSAERWLTVLVLSKLKKTYFWDTLIQE